MLKELRRKIEFEQKRVISALPSWMREKLEPDEFIYFVFVGNLVGTISIV